MSDRNTITESELKNAVFNYYDRYTKPVYMARWNPDYILFGLFEPGECPPLGSKMVENFSAHKGFVRALKRMIETIIAPANIQSDSVVVDAGCGIGGTALHLAKTRGCKVTGVNVVELQLEIANEKVNEAGLHELVSFKYADCSHSLPFDDNSVDVVTNFESACHYIDRPQFLREVYRILKPGIGRIVASDWLHRSGITDEDYEKFIRPLTNSWAIPSLESEDGYTRMLPQSGLRLIEFESFGGKDWDNVRIIRNIHHNLTRLYLNGLATPEFLTVFEEYRSLYMAWKHGHFELKRYCAEKPK